MLVLFEFCIFLYSFKGICLVGLFHSVTTFFLFFHMAANLFIGHSKSNLNSASQGFQPEISSQPMQVLLNKAHESSAYHLTDQSKIGLWNERTVCPLEMSDRGHEISSNKHLVSSVASHVPSPYTIAPSSDFARSWSHSVSSWERQSSSLSQKSISVKKQPYLNSSANLRAILDVTQLLEVKCLTEMDFTMGHHRGPRNYQFISLQSAMII